MTTERRSNILWEPDYQTVKWFSGKSWLIKMNKIDIKMKKPVSLCLLIPSISKITVYEH